MKRRRCSREDCKREASPVDQLDREIEEIRRLMLESTKKIVNNRWRLTRGDPATATGQQQEKQSRRAGGQLRAKVWDPGGSQ
jgi:hypothetical protein